MSAKKYPRPTSEAAWADLARETFEYDPDSGNLTRRVRAQNGILAGTVAGRLQRHARSVGLGGIEHRAHRIIWLMVHGRWPAGAIDHINRDPHDNRLVNLREASPFENAQNAGLSRLNKSGVTGVRFDGRDGRWLAQIRTGGRKVELGRYRSKEDAIRARQQAEAKYYPGRLEVLVEAGAFGLTARTAT